MLYVTFFDVVDLPWKRAPREAPADMTFTPTPTPVDGAATPSAPSP
jgi:hypothetical protein